MILDKSSVSQPNQALCTSGTTPKKVIEVKKVRAWKREGECKNKLILVILGISVWIITVSDSQREGV
jgi:hypothetical protein